MLATKACEINRSSMVTTTSLAGTFKPTISAPATWYSAAIFPKIGNAADLPLAIERSTNLPAVTVVSLNAVNTSPANTLRNSAFLSPPTRLT